MVSVHVPDIGSPFAGQFALRADRIVPAGCEAEAELCFRNIAAILASAVKGLDAVARVSASATAREHMAPHMKARNRIFSSTAAASTLVIVQGFTRAEFPAKSARADERIGQ